MFLQLRSGFGNGIVTAKGNRAIAHNGYQDQPTGWKAHLRRSLPLFGHRNWIVVADSAYPAHSGSGIEALLCRTGHLEVLRYLLASLSRERHVRSTFYFDRELALLEEGDAPRISSFRAELRELVGGDYIELPHNEIISKLSEASWSFRVLVLKTSATMPYTSVFVELQCRYWSEEAERRLRTACSEACVENVQTVNKTQ